jgi:hypothetical protein
LDQTDFYAGAHESRAPKTPVFLENMPNQMEVRPEIGALFEELGKSRINSEI